MNETTDIIKPQTAEEMTEAYKKAYEEIKEGYLLLCQAEKRLAAAFGDCYMNTVTDRVYFSHNTPLDVAAKVEREIRKTAWRKIIDRIGIKRMMTAKDVESLDKRIEKGDLPEITVEEIFSLLQNYQQDAEEIAQRLIESVFKNLTPQPHWGVDYKTNKTGGVVDKKVILSGMVERGYGGGRFKLGHYWQRPRLVEIDRAFHLLDGKMGEFTEGSYTSPLVDHIESHDGTGETKYFRYKCFNNGNLHLEFTRPDLVEKLNAIAGGANLPITIKRKPQASEKQYQQASFV